jgi:hypothetical protein
MSLDTQVILARGRLSAGLAPAPSRFVELVSPERSPGECCMEGVDGEHQDAEAASTAIRTLPRDLSDGQLLALPRLSFA